MNQNENERIAALETKITHIEKEIEYLREEQKNTNQLIDEIKLDNRDLKSDLKNLISALESHKMLHDKMSDKKFRTADVINSTGILLLGIIQLAILLLR